MTMYEVSVIVVNFNAGLRLEKCVSSVFTTHPGANVIVVDNASTDDSCDLLENAYRNDARLQVVRNTKNLGFSVACNIGISQTTAPYLLFLNPDCLLVESTLFKLRNCLINNSDVGMVGGFLINPDGSEQPGGRRLIPTPWRTVVRLTGLTVLSQRYPRLFTDFNLEKKPLPVGDVEVEAVSGACMLVKREALDNVGGFDEGYFLHCEDLDWCMRFRGSGWKIKFVPDAPVIHYQGVCSRTRPVFVEWHKHKGMLRFYRKFFRHQYPGPLMWLIIIAIWSRFSILATGYAVQRLGHFLLFL